jgi:5-methylthioadenosine/S-adenosylhomocysteine deaminase
MPRPLLGGSPVACGCLEAAPVALPAGAELIVAGGDIVTMNRDRDVIADGAVAIAGGRIVAVGKAADLRAAEGNDAPASVLDATGCVVTPGLIDAHRHLTGDPLVRSCIPDLLAPGASIFAWAVPIHAAHQPADEEVSATLAAVESLVNGTTMIVEAGTVAHPDRVAKALDAVGVRATVGTWGWDLGDGPGAAPAAEVLARQAEVVAAHPPGGRVEGWVTLVGHDLASDELFTGAAELAGRLGTGLTFHLSPTSADPDAYLARTGRRPVTHLADLGVLGRRLVLAHAVWLDDEELDAVLASGTAVASCPWAYLRLGQGITRAGRHHELVARRGRVALGTDAANASDLPDVLRAAALFAGLARDTTVDPERLGADTAFALATVGGAEAIGMGDRIGSIEPGKAADIVVHDGGALAWLPPGDPALHLVWGTDGRSVRDVVVDGRVVVRDGRCTTVDTDALRHEVLAAKARLLDRAGIAVPSRWRWR